jgi:hypothetical protein
MTLHAVVAADASPADHARIKDAVRRIGTLHNAPHVTVEFETAADNCEYTDCLHA